MKADAKWYLGEVLELQAQLDSYTDGLAKQLNVGYCVVFSDGEVSVDCFPAGVMGERIESEYGAFYAYKWEQDGVRLVHYTRRLSNESI